MLALDLRHRLEDVNRHILRYPDDAFKEIIAQLAPDILVGGQTLALTQRHIFQRFLRDSITGFVDVSGRRWRSGYHTEMTTRTATVRALQNTGLASMAASGTGPRASTADRGPDGSSRPTAAPIGSRSNPPRRNIRPPTACGHPSCVRSSRPSPAPSSPRPSPSVFSFTPRPSRRRSSRWSASSRPPTTRPRGRSSECGPPPGASSVPPSGLSAPQGTAHERDRSRHRLRIYRPRRPDGRPTVRKLPVTPARSGILTEAGPGFFVCLGARARRQLVLLGFLRQGSIDARV